MKRRQLFASALCVLALAACNKKPEEAVTTTAQATVQATTVAQTEHATYFEMLQLAYNVAAKDADITEGLAAAKKVRDEMFAQYPSDKDDIDNAYSDLELLVRFNATWIATFEESANQSIVDAMAIYARKRGEIYERTSPATKREYYDLAVPDQLFQYATVDGEKANFKWAGLNFQSGGDSYEIVECYVSESGTSVIVFAKKEGINVLLIGESEPQTTKKADGTIKSSVVNLQPYENDTLERALW